MSIIITSEILKTLTALKAVEGLIVGIREGSGGNSHSNFYFDIAWYQKGDKPSRDWETRYETRKEATICYTSSYSSHFSEYSETTSLTNSVGVHSADIDFFISKIQKIRSDAASAL